MKIMRAMSKLNAQRRPLISGQELVSQMNNNNLRIFSCTIPIPPLKVEAKSIFENKRITNAQFFDCNLISDKSNPLPTMMPDEQTWMTHMARLGVQTDTDVVLYDDLGIAGACRAYLMFKSFNPQHNVYILNSNLQTFQNQFGQFVENKQNDQQDIYQLKEQDQGFKKNQFFTADFNLTQQASYSESVLKKESFAIIDARSSERFEGKMSEPRKGLRAGNIAGSFNIFYKDLLNEDSSFKSTSELETIYKEKGVDVDALASKFIINSCGSGVTACVNLVAQELMGVHKRATVYDGSWTEYGQLPLYDNEEMKENLKLKVNRDNKPMKVELEAGKLYSYCICGKSETQPMCDSRHRGSEFRSLKFSVEEDKAYRICMCRKSQNLPFCDGSHRKSE